MSFSWPGRKHLSIQIKHAPYMNNNGCFILLFLIKPSEEEEIVDIMVKKICSLFGIRYKVTEEKLGSDVKDISDLTINNSRNIPGVNSFETSDNSVSL